MTVTRRRQGPRTQKIGRFKVQIERQSLYSREVLAMQGEEFVWDFAVLDKVNHMTFWTASDPRMKDVIVREDDIR